MRDPVHTQGNRTQMRSIKNIHDIVSGEPGDCFLLPNGVRVRRGWVVKRARVWTDGALLYRVGRSGHLDSDLGT